MYCESLAPEFVAVKWVLTVAFGSLIIDKFFSVSYSFARLRIMLEVVIASVDGAALKEIAVAVIASTIRSSVAPAVPVGIVRTSPTLTSAVL